MSENILFFHSFQFEVESIFVNDLKRSWLEIFLSQTDRSDT